MESPSASPASFEGHEGSGLRHERRHVADRAFDDDIEPAIGDAAAGGRVAVDHEQAAAAGCAGGLRRIAFDVDEARHHVLGDADARAAVDDDGRLLVHAGAVIADVAIDLDGRGRIDTDGDGVTATRIEDPELRLGSAGVETVQHLVELTQARDLQIDRLHRPRFP